MSTTDPRAAAGSLDQHDRLVALDAAAAGLPDPAVLARLANDIFREVPQLGQLAQLATAIPTTAPAAPSVGGLSLPGAGLPATVPGAGEAVSVATAAPVITIPGVPGIPGGFSPSQLSTEPSFGFLQEARSIFGAPPAAPVQAAPIPAPALPVTAAPSAAAAPPVPAAPQLAGTPSPALTREDFGFLAAANPLFEVVPVVDPLVPATALAAPPPVDVPSGAFDVAAVRRDFPILAEQVNGRQLVWLDNAATTQKPQAVIDRLAYYYQHENSNIHRAAHTLAARATDAYEGARDKVRRFLNAGDAKNIIFVRGATEGINLIAQSWGKRHLERGDEIIVSHLEHHANIVPWQMLAAEKGLKLKVAPVDDSGQILLDQYERLFTAKTKLVSITQVSNALGTVTPVAELTAIAHRRGAKIVIDGAQAVSHMAVDVQAIGADFYVFSGHKVFAPTGIGVVYGTSEVLEASPPYQGGGNMIADVTFEKTVYNPPPSRFEAGTGNIADAVGLGAAIDYLDRIGMHNIARYEHDLLVYGTEALRRVDGLRLIGTAAEKASVLSFVLDGYTTQQVGEHLSAEGIAVRSGHHCAQPILRRFGLESTVRPSLAFYNTCEEIDRLVAALWNLKGGRASGPR